MKNDHISFCFILLALLGEFLLNQQTTASFYFSPLFQRIKGCKQKVNMSCVKAITRAAASGGSSGWEKERESETKCLTSLWQKKNKQKKNGQTPPASLKRAASERSRSFPPHIKTFNSSSTRPDIAELQKNNLSAPQKPPQPCFTYSSHTEQTRLCCWTVCGSSHLPFCE